MENNGKGKSTIIRGILAGIILFYLFFAFLITDHMSASLKYGGTDIRIQSNQFKNFISPVTYADELPNFSVDSTLVSEINLSLLENQLKNIVNIEDVNITRTVGGKLKVNITPVVPVARVFNKENHSYYINRDGKKVKADIRYHKDVPILVGNIDDSVVTATDLLPLIDYICHDSLWNNLTTALKVADNYDIILIPTIKGHVVNLGNFKDKDFKDKFDRLKLAYSEILPNKGWLFYDTISVKYAAQIIGSKAHKRAPASPMIYELVDPEEVPLDNMSITPDKN